MKRLTYILLICGFLFSFGFSLPKWFPFSTDRALDEWESKILKGRVTYEVKHVNGESSLHALSVGAASAVFYRVRERFKAESYPMLSWKWKVVKFPDKEKLKMRQGVERDDYAARVYVIFPAFIFFQSKALEYVWDESIPEGSVAISSYSSNIRLIVVESGKDKPSQWILEERNIVEDYQKAFGMKPNLRVGAIALMSDADNTEGTSEAYFDEIRVGYKKGR